MSRYLPTGPLYACTCASVRACVTCARVWRRGLYLSRATSIIIHTSALHAYTGRRTDRQRELILSRAAANEHDLSLRCRGPAGRRPCLIDAPFPRRAHERANACVIRRLLSPVRAISGVTATLSHRTGKCRIDDDFSLSVADAVRR